MKRKSACLLWSCFCLLLVTGCKNSMIRELNRNDDIDIVNEQTSIQSIETEKNTLVTSIKGSHNGNLLNGGITAFNDNCIYYVNDNQTKLYKRIRATQEEKLILEDKKIYQLNIYDNYIYYLDANGNIMRLDLNNNNKELIFENVSHSFQNTCIVSDDSIFYARYDEFQKEISSLISMKLDGTQSHILSEQCNGYVSIYDNWLYYGSSEDGSIWRIKRNGKENQKIIDGQISHFLVDDDAIYYVKVYNDVIKCNLEGKNADYIYRGEVLGLNIFDNNIIILDENSNPAIIDGEKTKVLSNSVLLKVCIIDNEIFYVDSEGKMDKPILIQ